MIWVRVILVKLFEIFSVNSSQAGVFLAMISVKRNRISLGLYTHLFCMCLYDMCQCVCVFYLVAIFVI